MHVTELLKPIMREPAWMKTTSTECPSKWNDDDTRGSERTMRAMTNAATHPPAPVDAHTLHIWLQDGVEIALLDVREHGQYGESHLFFGVPLPYSRLEIEIGRLVPRRATRMVVYDDGDLGVASRAASRLFDLGYGNVHVLTGGTHDWKAAGFGLFAGVNVPSKAFGELVEHACHTPRISARQLVAMRVRGEDVIVVDGRPLAEFRKMSIPGAICCPNGELAYRIGAIAPDPRVPIVVNCAGRTRSLIGAQTLIDLGVPNPVYALENGTQGWYLADLPLDHGATRHYPDADASFAERARQAERLAARHGVRFVEDQDLERWLADASRTTYVFDVRTPEEHAAGTLPGVANAPGGQLLQATDQWVAVRGARIVLVDSDGVRAPVVASWLARMGHEAYVLERGIASQVRLHGEPVTLAELATIPADRLATRLAARDVAVVDVRPSMAYRAAHIPGSTWSIRPRLREVARHNGSPIALVADDPGVARIAAFDLARAGIADVVLLEGGLEGWRARGLPVASTPDDPPDAACIDFLFFVHDRHDGNKDAARRYLAWETQLLEQLDALERGAFRLDAAVAGPA